MPNRRRKAGTGKITHNEREKMYSVYAKFCAEYSGKDTLEKLVAKMAGVSLTTVRKYRKLDEWDLRYQKMREKAIELADYDLAKETAKNLRRIQKAKLVWEAQLENIELLNNVRLKDVVELLKIELVLAGQADSRTEVVDATQYRSTMLEEFLNKQRKKMRKEK